MQEARRWLGWRAIPQAGKKPRKVPFYLDGSPRAGTLDAPADLAKLGTFEDALKALATGRYTGLGFALGEDAGGFWQGIDLDGTDQRPELKALVDQLPGYVEQSPSGKGFHAIGRGRDFPTLASNTSGIEAYSKGRYFTVTGTAYGGDVADLAEFVNGTLAPLHAVGTTTAKPAKPGATEKRPPPAEIPEGQPAELRSALAAIPSDDRPLWIRMGQALCPLGEVGRALWVEWSQGSDKYDAKDAARVWRGFKADATGPGAVFAEAMRRGWVNPKRRVPPPMADHRGRHPAATAPETQPPEGHPAAAGGDPVPVPQAPEPTGGPPVTAGRDHWPDPGDLSGATTAKPYPVDCFPEPARSALIEYQRVGQQPMSLVASSALGQMSLAAQGLADVARNSHLSGPISLSLLIAAESGERKSAADKQFGRAARAWQARERERGTNENRRARAMKAAWVERVKGVSGQIKALAAKDSAESKAEIDRLQDRLIELEQNPQTCPPLPLLTYEDVTPAAFAYNFALGWPSAALSSDEGGIVVGSHGMGDETATSMLSILNICWDGRDYIPVRKQALTAELRGRRLSTFLMIQPSLLPKLIDKGARDIGFIARFLLSSPVSTMGTRMYADPPDDWPALNDFDAAVLRLLDLPLPIDRGGEDQGDLMRLIPPVMCLSAGAKRDWVEYHNAVEGELRQFGEFCAVRDVGSKSAENAARVAAVFKVFDQGKPGQEVEQRYMEAGIKVASWHLNETVRLFDQIATPEDRADARELSAWLGSRALELADADGTPIVNQSGEIATRDILRLGPNPVRDSARRDAAIAVLADAGHVRMGGSGKQKRLLVNPKLLKKQ
ncbi:DUF3987 domain-containing protein [uncultured Thiodictyon sp.]|jgi:hypothetical protein|uniref:DUF3987 domain-containing protein n=1 Tax=uncultured Thiodictyon sp. TaxID=1846217 RepID=UPI0025E3B49D|nr:DUF3987 domain-containing protein [uncultured Thiodictyon sp.]